jgi:hypothetical protein
LAASEGRGDSLARCFEAEGNAFICDNWLREADEEFLPAIEAETVARYLYHVRL